MVDYASIKAKLDRSHEHIGAFEAELGAWLDKKLHRLVHHANPDFTVHRLVYRCSSELNLERLAVIFGDAIHNLRSALDHAMYSIARLKADSVSPKRWEIIAKNIAFPISIKPEAITQFRKAYCDVLTRDVIDVLERYQPYNRPHRKLPPLLLLIRELDDLDKHRLLPVVFSQAFQWEYQGNLGVLPDCAHPVAFIPYDGELKDGMTVMTAKARCPSPNLDMNGIKITLGVVINHPPGPHGIDRSTYAFVFNEVFDEAVLVINELMKAL